MKSKVASWGRCCLFSVLGVLVIMSILYSTRFYKPLAVQGTSDSVIQDSKLISSYIENVYGRKFVSSTLSAEKKLNSLNYSQSDIREYYNRIKDDKAKPISSLEGICWASTITSITKFNGVTTHYKSVGKKAIDFALTLSSYIPEGETKKKGRTVLDGKGNGIDTSDVKFILPNMMLAYKKGDYTANNDYYDIYKTLKDEIQNGRATAFYIIGHAMTGCGYREYTVTYKKAITGKKATEKQKFVIVNDTWDNNRQYSYFPEREIGTNILTRWNFGITKFKKK